MAEIRMTEVKQRKPRTKKEPIVHRDFLDRPIALGDFVVICSYNKMKLAKVIKVNPKTIRLRFISEPRRPWMSRELIKSPSEVTVIDNSPHISMYILRNVGS